MNTIISQKIALSLIVGIIALCLFVGVASADHGDEVEEESHATTVHDSHDEDDDVDEHGDDNMSSHDEDSDHHAGISTLSGAEKEQLIALLKQLIALLSAQKVLIEQGESHEHDEDHEEDHA